MRKNRTKHEAKKPRLAKRALALCFALIFVCSCLLPAFAHSGENQLTDLAQETVVEPQQDEQQPEELSLLNESGTDSTEGNEQHQTADDPTEEPKPAEQEPKADEPKNEEPKTEETKNEGTTESKGSAEQQGNEQTKPEEQPKTEGTTGETKPEEQPKTEETKPEGTTEETKTEETKPEEPKQPTTNTTGDTIEQGEATYTYRFWPDKIDAFDLEAINADVKSGTSLNDAAQLRAGMVPCTVLTVMTNANLRDYQANVQQPTKDGYEFAGWYTVDGTTEDEFSFEQSLNFEESKTIDVFAKWEKVESTAEDEMEKTEPTTEDELEKTEPGKANESKEETLLPVEKTGEVSLMIDEDETVSIAVKAENLPGKVNELVVTDLNEDEEGAAFGNALAASSYKDWTVTNLMVNITPKDAEGKTVEPNEAVTVHFSGLESLMIQYSSEMNLKVLHMKRDGTLEALSLKNVQTKETQEGTVLSSFAVSTTSFSPFVLAASESASVEPASLTLGKAYPKYDGLTVGESIVIKSDWKIYSNSWSTSNDALEIVGTGIDSDGYPYARVKAKKTTNKVKIQYGWSSYTFSIEDSRDEQTADIFFLKTPGTSADTNDETYWLPQYWKDGKWQSTTNWTVKDGSGTNVNMDGKVNTAGATWDDQNKNIVLNGEGNSATMVRSWPDGSTENTWTLYRNHSDVTDNRDKDLNQNVFFNVLDSIWDTYQTELAKDLGVSADTLQKKQITQITLTPYKISSNDSMHIDCTISAKGIAYTAKFWVEEPGETSYKQVYAKNYANDAKVKEPTDQNMVDWGKQNGDKVSLIKDKGCLPETVEKHGVTYRFAGWYPEGNPDTTPNLYRTVPFGSDGYGPSDAEKQNGVVNFYARYVADNQGRLDEHPYITVEKQIKGLPSAKVDELLNNFKVKVGGFVLNSSNYGFTKKTNGDETTLRWKIDDVAPGSYLVNEEGCTVNGYTLEEKVGDGETFDVENATFTATAKRITEQNSKDFKVGESGEQYWVFVASLTKASKNVVISNRTLSAKERASIVKAVNQLEGTIGNQSTLDFYSVAENQEITIKDDGREYKITYKNYNEKVHGPGIHIEAESMWNMVASVNYTMDNAQSADVQLINTYKPATLDIRITKQVASGDKTKCFKFKVTSDYFSTVNNVSLTNRGCTSQKPQEWFYLKDGESATLHGLKKDYIFTIEEEKENSVEYDTTATENIKVEAGNTKSFRYKVVEENGQLVLQPIAEKGNSLLSGKLNITDGKVVVTNSAAATSLTVTKNVVEGNAKAPDNAEFTFRLTVKNDVKVYQKVNLTKRGEGITEKSVVSGHKNQWEFTLKNGESVHISGIRIDDENVKVEEVGVDGTYYTTKYSVNNGAAEIGTTAEISTTTLSANQNSGTTVEFTNTYNVPNLNSMTIKKVVTGAFGERTKEFAFSVTMTNDKGLDLTGVSITGADSKDSFKLKHGQQVTLGNIPVGTTITITESNANDYDTKATNYDKANDKTFVYKVVNENGKAVLKSTGANAAEVKDNAITVTNNFDGTPDTGVLLDTLPYLILLAVAVAGGVLVVVRKHKHRDE